MATKNNHNITHSLAPLPRGNHTTPSNHHTFNTIIPDLIPTTIDMPPYTLNTNLSSPSTSTVQRPNSSTPAQLPTTSSTLSQTPAPLPIHSTSHTNPMHITTSTMQHHKEPPVSSTSIFHRCLPLLPHPIL